MATDANYQISGSFEAPEEIGRWRTLALGIGGVAAVAILLWALLVPEARPQALRSWLLGFIFWSGLGFGSLGLLLLQYLTGGAWGVVIRRILEAGSRTLPIIFVLFLPLIFGLGSLYEWTHPAPGDKVLEHKAPYLNSGFWVIRSVIYFVLLGIMAVLLNRWSKQQEETGDLNLLSRMSQFSGPTMVIFVLVLSFASIDWVMTLDPHWYSTIFGLLFVIGWALSTLAFVIILLSWLVARAPMNRILGQRHLHDLGKLMLAFVMVWAYFNFSQYLIIWSGNLPEETVWYLARQRGGWGWLGGILIVFHFAFPFLMLLSRDIKRNYRWLSLLALFILVMRLLDFYYIIGPSPMVGAPHGAERTLLGSLHLMDLIAPIAVGGIWLWWFFGELVKRPLVPTKDPFLQNAIEHGRGH